MTASKIDAEKDPRTALSAEKRRSQRVMIRVPVTLRLTMDNQAMTLDAYTLVVNDHGALLVCSQTLPAESTLEIKNNHTGKRASCRVTRTPGASGDGFLIPVELRQPSSSFWHISFPSPDLKR